MTVENMFDQMAARDAAAGPDASSAQGSVFDQMAARDAAAADGALGVSLGNALKSKPDQAASDKQIAAAMRLPW